MVGGRFFMLSLFRYIISLRTLFYICILFLKEQQMYIILRFLKVLDWPQSHFLKEDHATQLRSCD